jgi:hypothetical protein
LLPQRLSATDGGPDPEERTATGFWFKVAVVLENNMYFHFNLTWFFSSNRRHFWWTWVSNGCNGRPEPGCSAQMILHYLPFMEDIRSSAEKYWAPLSAAEPLGDNWGIQKKIRCQYLGATV